MTAPHRELGLTDFEYDRIVELMGREPNQVELAIFSLMWSEHCGYKHSRKLLKTLPTEGPRVVMGPGENAGAVDVGGGMSCAFKVESHNHPSAVEPFQGAATGVGGILRDVFAVGARPIAVLDSLRFGEPGASARSRYLLERAVAGIGHYGNSIGVATVGGEIYFESAYEQNCLVNAMCLGLIETEKLIRSAAAGVGNVVVLFGARTGRDGIGGASVLASAELGDEDASKRPTVQIGDPFEEAKLLECSLELLDRGLLVALQDLGAAGPHVVVERDGGQGRGRARPRRHEGAAARGGMEPFEIMISESQERMLCVVEPALVDEVIAVCAKWEVNATAIGVVTDTRRLRVLVGDEVAGDLPVTALVDECPAYDLEPAPPSVPLYAAPPRVLERRRGAGRDAARAARLGQPRLAPPGLRAVRRDRRLAHRAAARAGRRRRAHAGRRGRAAARARRGHRRQRAARRRAIPYRGAVEAVLECSANLACVGAEPLGLTNCLNFGNPEKPHIAWQLTRAVAGLGDACRALGVPVVGGNVSLYNEGGGGPIFPTPVVGMVGELPDAARAGRLGFAQPGDAVALIAGSGWAPSLTGSELAKLRGEAPAGELPAADLGELRTLHAAVRQAVRSGALRSVHDVAEGGARRRAGRVLRRGRARRGGRARRRRPRRALFGEGPGAFVASGPREAFAAFGGGRDGDRHRRRRGAADRRRRSTCRSPSSPACTPAGSPSSCAEARRDRSFAAVADRIATRWLRSAACPAAVLRSPLSSLPALAVPAVAARQAACRRLDARPQGRLQALRVQVAGQGRHGEAAPGHVVQRRRRGARLRHRPLRRGRAREQQEPHRREDADQLGERLHPHDDQGRADIGPAVDAGRLLRPARAVVERQAGRADHPLRPALAVRPVRRSAPPPSRRRPRRRRRRTRRCASPRGSTPPRGRAS